LTKRMTVYGCRFTVFKKKDVVSEKK